jgi:hypothetical protein
MTTVYRSKGPDLKTTPTDMNNDQIIEDPSGRQLLTPFVEHG